MVKIVDRYILAELLPPFLLGICGFVLIMVTDLLFTFTDLIINRGVPVEAILKLLFFKLPAIMVLAFPVSTLFATSMVLTRLAKDNELTALRTSGMNLLRLSLPIILASFLISIGAYLTNEKVVPWTNHISENIIRQVILKNPLPEVKENVFFRGSENRYFYVHKVNSKLKILENIMIYELTFEKLPQVIVAQKAKWEERFWNLEEGYIHKYDENGRLAYEAKFDKMRIPVHENILTFTEQKTPQEMTSAELKDLIDLLKKGGVSTAALAVDFYMKFSIPITSLVFALIGIPLSLPPVRFGRTWGIILSIALVFSFYVWASVFRSLGRGGILPPYLAAWMPQVLTATLGGGLIIREGYFK